MSSHVAMLPRPDAAARSAVQPLLEGCWRALLRAWSLALALAVALSALRLAQIAYYEPSGRRGVAWNEVAAACWRGARFDLKVSAIAALLLLPLLWPRWRRPPLWAAVGVGAAFMLLGMINFHYFGFYKTPIDALVFGLFEDDTRAVLETIRRDHNLLLALAFWLGASASVGFGFNALLGLVDRRAVPVLARRMAIGTLCGGLALVALLFAAKGTWRGMALQKQHFGVATSPFLNAMVPNGVIALKYAWDDRQLAHDFSDDEAGVRSMGFDSVQQAAEAFGLHASGREAIARALQVPFAAAPAPRRNLVFLQMESWSAEPLRYQAPGFDVLGRLAGPLGHAYQFTSFDSAQDGTHPTLEAILFGTPITPLTQGPDGRLPISWSVARVLKQAGFDTLFVTSGQSGWRDLNRVLAAQGFDEVVDAATLRALYPQAQGSIWGVWDDYLFDYLRRRLAEQPRERPIFIFGMSTTNHPPYELPADYAAPALDMRLWLGETGSDALAANLASYRYANDRLGEFMARLESDGSLRHSVVAASGDHNVRSFGIYATPDRLALKHRVPFVVWTPEALCRDQLALPASHRDMFPTLFPLAGIGGGYLRTGRNLFDCLRAAAPGAAVAARSLSFTGDVRNAAGVWRLGQPQSFVCTGAREAAAGTCRFAPLDDRTERAYWALMDWNVRSSLKAAHATLASNPSSIGARP